MHVYHMKVVRYIIFYYLWLHPQAIPLKEVYARALEPLLDKSMAHSYVVIMWLAIL